MLEMEGEMISYNLDGGTATAGRMRNIKHSTKKLTERILVSLHKEGEETDMGYYKGITQDSHMGRIFSQVLNTRLILAVEEAKIRGEARGGVRKGNQTVCCKWCDRAETQQIQGSMPHLL